MANSTLFRNFLCTVLVALSTASCLERQFSEVDAAFSSDRTDVKVDSEDPLIGFLTDTLKITSNRSWTAEIAYDAASGQTDWISIEDDFSQHENIGNITDTRCVPIEIENNRYDTPRSAEIVFHYEGHRHSVNLVQGGLTYRMIPSVTEINNILDIESTQTFFLDSNIPWTIRVKEGSTADVEVLTPSGTGSAEISVLVKDNLDFITKDAVLMIEAAEGFDFNPVTVTLHQRECTPYLEIDRERSRTEILPLESVDTVFFSTNGDWEAHLEDVSGDITLDKTSGSNKEWSLVVNFGKNLGKEAVGSTKTATVIIESNGIREEIIISQKYWMHVELVFHNGSSLTASAKWPLLESLSTANLPASSTKPAYKGELVSAPMRDYPDITLSILATSGMWRNSNQGFNIKGAVGDYIEISAISGKSLMAVAVTVGTSSFNMSLTDVNGVVVEGGECITSGWKVHVPQYWMLTGTQPSTPYRWTFSTAATSMIHILEFFYQ